MKRIVNKVFSLGIAISILASNFTIVQAAPNSLHSKLGIENVYYPEMNNQIGLNSYFTRLDYGMSEGTGKGVRLLIVDYYDKTHEWNDTKLIYDYIIPDAIKTYVYNDGILKENLKNVISEEQVKENDIIVVNRYSHEDSYLLELVKKYPDKYFVINGEYKEPNNQGFVDCLTQLKGFKNTLIVAGSNGHGVETSLISKKTVHLFDVFVQAQTTEKDNEYGLMYENNYNETERMDNVLAVASSSLAILLENNVKIDDVGSYYNARAKKREDMFQFDHNNLQDRYEYDVPLLDYKLLFDKKDNENFAVNTYNLPEKYKGEGIDIFLIDSGYNTTYPKTKGFVKDIISFPSTYKPKTGEIQQGEDLHGNYMAEVVKDIVPNANVNMLLVTSKYVNGSWDTTYYKDALDWVINNADKVDILSTSWHIAISGDEEILSKLRQIAEKGVVVSWFWMPERISHPNIITPGAYKGRNGGDIKEPLGEDLTVYDRYFSTFENTNQYDWGNSQTAPTGASLTAILKQIKPTITGAEIKQLYKGLVVEIDRVSDVGIPNMERIVNLLENQLTYVKDVPINAKQVTINFSRPTNVKINGIPYKEITMVKVPYKPNLSIAIDKDGKRLIEGTQLVDIDMAKAQDGTLFLESTFNGTIKTDVGSIEVVIGLNKVSEKDIKYIDEIIINYNLD